MQHDNADKQLLCSAVPLGKLCRAPAATTCHPGFHMSLHVSDQEQACSQTLTQGSWRRSTCGQGPRRP